MSIVSHRFARLPNWFPYFDLACVLTAAGFWYVRSPLVPWTLPLSLALAPWMARWLLVGRPSRRTPFDIPLALFVATAALAVWAAFDQEAAWHKFWLIVGAVLIFYALVNGRSLLSGGRSLLPGGRSLLPGATAGDPRVWLMVSLGSLLSLYFLASHDWQAQPAKIEWVTRLGLAWQTFLPDVPGHRLTSNVTGGILAMTAPFGGAAVLAAWSATRRRGLALLLAGLPLGLILLALFMTTSRGAWMGLVAALLLGALWLGVNWLAPHTLPAAKRPSTRRRRRRQRLIFYSALAAVVAILLLLLLNWPGGYTALLARFLPGQGTDFNRLTLWRNSLILALDYPFVGAGLGGYMMLYSTYSLLIHVGFSYHSHNMFLDVAVEQGFLALLILLATWLFFFWIVERDLRPQRKRTFSAISPALGAAALALVVMLVHGLLDDTFYGSRAILFLFTPLAFAVSRPVTRGQSRSPHKSVSPWLPALDPRQVVALVIAAAMLLLPAALSHRQLVALYHANLGAVYQSRAELSVYSWPEWPIQDEVRRQVDLTPAVAAFQQALALNPYDVTANRRLGMIALSYGQYREALAYLEAAHTGTPWDNATRQLLGEAYVVNGRVAEGMALWSTIDNAQGQLSGRLFWYQHVRDAERQAWVREAMMAAGR